MPVIHLKLSGNEDPVLANELAKTISNLTKEHLNKRPEVTVRYHFICAQKTMVC